MTRAKKTSLLAASAGEDVHEWGKFPLAPMQNLDLTLLSIASNGHAFSQLLVHLLLRLSFGQRYVATRGAGEGNPQLP